jgi:hypothetical protein
MCIVSYLMKVLTGTLRLARYLICGYHEESLYTTRIRGNTRYLTGSMSIISRLSSLFYFFKEVDFVKGMKEQQ